MADFTTRVIDDGKRVIVKKQQVEVIHGVSWRISTSKTVRNSQRQIRLAMSELDKQRQEFYSLSLDELQALYPKQFERHVKMMDKRSNVRRSYRLDTLLPRYVENMRTEGAKVEQVIVDETNTLRRHIRLMNWSNRDVRSITCPMLDKLFLSFFEESPNRARGTWKKDISRWQQFYDWIVKIGYLEDNKMRVYEWTVPVQLSKNNREDTRPKRVYTKHMLDDLYWYLDRRVMDYRYKRAMQLMIDTGLRIGECLALTLGDIRNAVYYGSPISRTSNNYGRLLSAYDTGIRQAPSSVNSEPFYMSESDKLLMLNKELFLNTFDRAEFYSDLVEGSVHDLDYVKGDLLFFADITDDIDSYLRVVKTTVRIANPGKVIHKVQDEAKTEKGNRTVSLNRRARRTLTLLYRELQKDAAFERVVNIWDELGRKYLFIKPSGDFLVSNNVSENLRYITGKMAEQNQNFYPITAHDLRHAYTTYKVHEAKDFGEVTKISRELGHKSPNTTLNAYTHSESANLLYEDDEL